VKNQQVRQTAWNGRPINDLQKVAYSTLTAIMGRMSASARELIRS